MQIKSDRIVFPDNTEQFTAGGGSGGGGSVETVDAPAFSASLSAPASMSNTGWTKVPFSVVEYDTENSFDTTNNRFNPSVAGYYKLTFNARFNGNVKSCFGAVYLNGSEKFSTYNSSEKLSTTLLVEGTVYLNGTTDYVEAFVFHGSDTPLDLSNSLSHTYFQGVLVKPANSGTLVGGEPVTLDALGIPNHDKVVVDESGKVTLANQIHFPNGGGNCIKFYDDASNDNNTIGSNGGVMTFNSFGSYVFNRAVNGTIAQVMQIKDDGCIAIPSQSEANYVSQYGLSIYHGCPDTNSGNASLNVHSTHGSNDNILIAEFKNATDSPRLKIATSGRVDINGGLYVNGTPKSLEVMLSDVEIKLADRDKIIDKLMAKVEALEVKLKKVK